ncbi:hypothetical protein WMY93_008317 [Mugilogobius chulae]|uniref:L1 transposable element RRM domain-containing protein n=1 Tax=Mugilogobius chulae TaxID=88201 RepID=A0AAW0PKL2_9GOBI
MDPQKVIKPAKLHPPVPPKPKSQQQPKENEHDYVAMDVSMQQKRGRGEDSAPPTPGKQPADKKPKSTEEENEAQVSNNDIFQAIIGLKSTVSGVETRVANVESQLGDIKKQNQQASAMLANLAKAVQVNAKELADCIKRVDKLESAKGHLLTENNKLKDKVRDLERYKMRWCLKLRGVQEKKDENIRAVAIKILQRVAPDIAPKLEDAVDVVHRLGKKEDGRTRQIIILFAHRRVKEEVWRKSKDSVICRDEGISFAEMLPQEDLEERRRLWPVIEQARRAGKRAFFRGPHAYIDGRRVEENEQKEQV